MPATTTAATAMKPRRRAGGLRTSSSISLPLRACAGQCLNRAGHAARGVEPERGRGVRGQLPVVRRVLGHHVGWLPGQRRVPGFSREALAAGVGPGDRPAVDRGVAGVGDGHLALEVPGPAVVGGPEGGRAVTVGRRRGLLVRGGGGRAGGAAARADTRDLAVAAVEDDVRAAEEVLVAVGAL